MHRPEPKASLIITTYQMPRHLERVLASVAQQTLARELEVIVSDDGSTDETQQLVETFSQRMPFPVHYVSHDHDGFQLARSRNRGVARSTSPHLVFLDGDCLIPPDHVEQHLRCHRPGIVTNTYCVRLDEPTSKKITLDQVNSRRYLDLVPRSELRKLAAISRKAWFYSWLRHPSKPALRGGNVGLSRADYLRVNGYDENFRGWGCEDDDLGHRLRSAGLKIEYILHRTRTYHLWHPPAVTKPTRMRDGKNFQYLTRPIRLTHCIRGVLPRSPRDLSIRLAGQPSDATLAGRFLAARSFLIEQQPQERADLEVLFWPGQGNFGGLADCRVLVVLDQDAASGRIPRLADIVLSPNGQVGLPNQIRLRLDDATGLAGALGWQSPRHEQRKAA